MAGGNFDGGWVAADLLALVAHDAEDPTELVVVGDAGKEAVAVASGTPRGQLRVAADDDGNTRFLHRLRVRLELAPAEELARERFGFVLPQGADGAHRLRRARGALGERNSERVELLLEPADSDAENG